MAAWGTVLTTLRADARAKLAPWARGAVLAANGARVFLAILAQTTNSTCNTTYLGLVLATGVHSAVGLHITKLPRWAREARGASPVGAAAACADIEGAQARAAVTR